MFQDDKMKQSLKVKLEMAKFLQQTLDEMAVTGKGHSSKGAKEFIEFFEKVIFVLLQILVFVYIHINLYFHLFIVTVPDNLETSFLYS